jgi:hypothetical protein
MKTTTVGINYPVWQSFEEHNKGKKNLPEENDTIKHLGSATDFQLVQAASQGDMATFEEIYNRHHRRVYSLCLRMLQNTTEAEDLTQDVFIQLYCFAQKLYSKCGFLSETTKQH